MSDEKKKPVYTSPKVIPVGNVKDLVGQTGQSNLDCDQLPPQAKPPWCP